MRKVMVPFLAAGMILSAFPTFAETYTGVVEGFDVEMSLLFLDQDQEFLIPEDVELPEISAGDTIIVDYDDRDGTKVVNAITLAQ